MSDVPLDIMGREIKEGDTVVYGVKSEYSTLNVAKVLKVIPYLVKDYKHERQADGTWLRIDLPDKLNWKFQLEVNTTRWDSAARAHVPVTAKRTLDTPRRFAVVEPANVTA